MRHASLLICVLVAAGPNALGAQEFESRPSTRETVTEAVFLDALDETHPAFRALAGDLGRAEAERLRASLLGDPRLEVAREGPEDLATETTWGVAWTPPIDGRRKRAREVGDAGVEAESHLLDGRLLDLRFDMREGYAAWATGEARASLFADHRDRVEALSRRMRDRAAAGEESQLSAQRLEIAFESSRVALSQARAAAARGRERAAAWLGVDREVASVRPRLPELPGTPYDLDALATGSRPDVLAARSRVEQAESLDRLSRRIFEAPELLLGWQTVENDLPGGGSDFDGPVFAIGWRVPVFDRRRADRLAARSAVATATAGEEWTARQARSELTAALAAYQELRRSALAVQDGLTEHDEIARAAAASFEAGESTVTDLLDTLRALLEARLASLHLYAEALEAHRQLELASGRALTTGDLS